MYHHHQHSDKRKRDDLDTRNNLKKQGKNKRINSFPSRSQENFLLHTEKLNNLSKEKHSSFSSIDLYEKRSSLPYINDKKQTKLNKFASIGDIAKTIVTYDANISLTSNANLFKDKDQHQTDGKIKTIRGNRISYPIRSKKPNNFEENLSENSQNLSDFYANESSTLESVNSTLESSLESVNSGLKSVNLDGEGEILESKEDKAHVISIDYPSESDVEDYVYDTVNNVEDIGIEHLLKTSSPSSTNPNAKWSEEVNKLPETNREETNHLTNSPNNNNKEVLPPKIVKKDLIKTSIQVPGFDKVIDEYKTIVKVDHCSKDLQIDANECNKFRKHSHNYLREFLASHKGSRNPLQNFLSKKFSRAFHAKPVTNLIENQYNSLPDINVSKNLQNCEKIDKKLRNNTNRFVINIGNHFDEFSSKRSYPELDFELKISKIPSTRKNRHKNCEEIIKMDETNKNEEFKQKIDNMRNYWSKIIGNNYVCEKDKSQEEEIVKNTAKCKIIDVQEKKNAQFDEQIYDNKPKFAINCEMTNNSTFFSNPYYENQYESLNPNGVEIVENLDKQNYKKEHYCKKKDNCKNDDFCTKDNLNVKDNFCTKDSSSENYCTKDTLCEEKDICNGKNICEEKVTLQNKQNNCNDGTKVNKFDEPEFDYVRYRVIKSDLFQKKIFANCENKSQFDELLIQYLQNYSFQELLIGNNVVIIEPIRFCKQNETKTTTNEVTSMLHKSANNQRNNLQNNSLRRHFFYHPVRVNREVREDELPNPDTVKQVRKFFECELTKGTQNPERLNRIRRDSLRYSSDDSSLRNSFNYVQNNDVHYDSFPGLYCNETRQYVSEDVLEKIRSYGTSVTYYGGRILRKEEGEGGDFKNTLTKAIMKEIKEDELKNNECRRCRNVQFSNDINNENDCTFANNDHSLWNNKNNDWCAQNENLIKFKLLKSNSCSSRLELLGTKSQMNLVNAKQKSINKMSKVEQDRINETIKKNECIMPKIIGEEMKMVDSKKEDENCVILDAKSCKEDINKSKSLEETNEITEAVDEVEDLKKRREDSMNSSKDLSKIRLNYEYQDYQKLVKPRIIDDIEFEPYEIAGN